MLLLPLVLAVTSLLVEIDRPAVVSRREALTLATSIETWRWYQDEEAHGGWTSWAAKMVPLLNDHQQLRHPPATTWAHRIAFASLDEKTQPKRRQFVRRARLTTACFALVIIASVYWAGHSIGGATTAMLGALVCVANPVFLFHARLATAATQHAALSVLAIAAALWAIRPLRPAPSVERQFIGWVTCGLALGLAILSGGAWTFFHVAVTVLALLILCPDRMSHLLGLLAALLIGVLMVIPWAVYADEHDPQAYQYWISTIVPTDWTDMGLLAKQAGQRAGTLMLAMLPWTLWLIGAVVQPFSTSSSGSRLRMLQGWVWFAVALVLVIFDPNRVALVDQLIILPAASILIGQLFRQYSDLAAEARYARFWRLLRWPHLLMLVVASVGVPALMYLGLIKWMGHQVIEPPAVYFGIGLAVVLLFIVFLSLRLAVYQFPARALSCWAIWTVVLVTVVAIHVARGPAMNNLEVERVADLASDWPIYWLRPNGNGEPDPRLLLYAERPIAPVTESQLAQLQEKHDRFLLAAPSTLVPKSDRLRILQRFDSLQLSFWRYAAGDSAVPPSAGTTLTNTTAD